MVGEHNIHPATRNFPERLGCISKSAGAAEALLAINARRQGQPNSLIRLDEHHGLFRRSASRFEDWLERIVRLAGVNRAVGPGQRVVLPPQRQRQFARETLVSFRPPLVDDHAIDAHRPGGGFLLVAGSQRKILTRAGVFDPD